MQVCEPYTLQQSKPTDDVVYDEYQQPTWLMRICSQNNNF